MKYVLLDNRIVIQTLPENDEAFPGIPISERYAQEFLSHCIVVPDETPTKPGQEYDASTQTFRTPLFTETIYLGQQITDEQLARIELGQRQTDIELSILGGTQHV